uniref:Major facilitator superfamily (MFS) profile domain-containing protein n=1 Tax=Leersia perrieri TaxID=77586 RepID=A0A0D9XX84_9ORYZ
MSRHTLWASYFLARTSSSVPWGIFADKYGRKPCIVISIISVIIFNTLFGLSTTYWMAIVSRGLLGLLYGILGPIKAYTSEVCMKEHRALGMSLETLHMHHDDRVEAINTLEAQDVASVSEETAQESGSGRMRHEKNLLKNWQLLFSFWVVRSRKYRGLSLTSKDVGIVLSVSGIGVFVYQFVIYPLLHKYVGSIKQICYATILSIAVVSSYPFMAKLYGVELKATITTACNILQNNVVLRASDIFEPVAANGLRSGLTSLPANERTNLQKDSGISCADNSSDILKSGFIVKGVDNGTPSNPSLPRDYPTDHYQQHEHLDDIPAEKSLEISVVCLENSVLRTGGIVEKPAINFATPDCKFRGVLLEEVINSPNNDAGTPNPKDSPFGLQSLFSEENMDVSIPHDGVVREQGEKMEVLSSDIETPVRELHDIGLATNASPVNKTQICDSQSSPICDEVHLNSIPSKLEPPDVFNQDHEVLCSEHIEDQALPGIPSSGFSEAVPIELPENETMLLEAADTSERLDEKLNPKPECDELEEHNLSCVKDAEDSFDTEFVKYSIFRFTENSQQMGLSNDQFFFENYTVQRRHSQRMHTHPYKRTYKSVFFFRVRAL